DGDERDTFAATAPDGFYRVLILETARAHPKDPATRLFTKEAFALYLRKLAPDGIICLHTSSRNYGLAPAIADTAYSLDLHCVHANDSDTALKWAPPPKYSISDWVMVARRREVLAQLTVPGFGNPDETTRA